MDTVKISNYIDAWLANNAGRANSMSMQIQKITDEYLEICIEGKVLQVVIPHNFYTSCSSDGIISNTNCTFVGTLTTAKSEESNNIDTGSELMIALNEKLDRLSSRGIYSFSTVLDSILDAFEKYKSSTESDGAASEIDDEEDEDGWSSDDEGYTMALGTSRTSFALNEGPLENGYFDQLIEDANQKCDGARSVAMSTKIEVPDIENIKDDILRWCKVYSPSDNNWCVGFEIELTGILSEHYRHRFGHVFEALGFSFATPLVIKVMFQPLGRNFEGKSLESQGESLSGAFRELSAMHGDMEFKVPKFVYSGCDGQDDLDQQPAKLIDLSKTNPLHLYGLRSLLPRIAKDFFSRGGKDPNVLLACEDNIFVRFLLFTGSRLASLLKRCIVCDKELPFTVSRLCSCADELCLFGFEVLGLGAQVLQELVRMPLELIDLEISLALAAASRSRDVFEPFPPFLLEERGIRQRSDLLNNNRYAKPQGNPKSMSNIPHKNIGALMSIIASFPSVSEMRLCADEAELKAKLAKSWLSTTKVKSVQKLGDEFPYNVLRFILCSNRLSLVFLSEDEDKVLKLDNSHSRFYQFAVVQDSPEREVMYTSRINHEVSRFGFHGSPRENWYSILRNGLRCLSNTKLMSGGNSLGDGIYLANNFELSAMYASKTMGYDDRWSNGMYKDAFYVVSICEVISSPSIKEGSDIFVVPKEQEENVAVRYLLVHGAHDEDLIADISDGHILSHGGESVDLIQHHQNIRQKYASVSCCQ